MVLQTISLEINSIFINRHENNMRKGTEHNVLVMLRYAKDKEVTAVFSVFMPRGILFAIDTAANITVPGFDSCTFNFKIKEKARKEYYVSCSWKCFMETSGDLPPKLSFPVRL